ncbi:copper resistance protein B [Massilia arenosa]|uniref:Copper resistance protein B n=2 Tax=Zemynaea arenosa TaxID=2561931 RepID=A0A4Y9S0B1_9BURK|nr:copper resistance protein B [Massilia arenosa]
MPGMQMDSMPGMTMGPMQGGQPPANARAPDYSEGTQRSHLGGMEMADDMLFGRILVDRLEWSRDRHATSARTESEAWYGGDIDKVWFKLDAERRGGRLDSARTELLWNRNVAAFWSTQLGARHDTGGGPARDWLAAGIQGLAPYRFETEATAYVGRAGSLAARFNVKYELLFTPRLILEPELAANMYSRADRERGLGAGLSDTSAALTLRYEVTRQFAPYLGLEWTRRFHQTADLAQSEGRQTSATALRFGVRLWY